MRSARGSRFRRVISHPATGLLAGVVSLGVLAVALTFDVGRGASMPIDVRRAECYSMTYGDPMGAATSDYFPARLILLPGVDSGAVHVEGSNPRALWWVFAKASTWRAVGRDSIALDLTNGFAHIDVRASRLAGRLSGRATYRANLAAPVSPPSMRFSANWSRATPPRCGRFRLIGATMFWATPRARPSVPRPADSRARFEQTSSNPPSPRHGRRLSRRRASCRSRASIGAGRRRGRACLRHARRFETGRGPRP